LEAIERNESSDQSERELFLFEVTAPARPHRSVRTGPGAPRPSPQPSA
jgi:hypothetical protein